MEQEKLSELVRLHTGDTAQNVEPLSGGFRNKVYRVSVKSRTLILKKHRPSKGFNFFENEVKGYTLLGSRGCRVPQVVFVDNHERVIAMTEIKGKALQEGENPEYYTGAVKLLKDTY